MRALSPDQDRLSRAIGIARVMCILGIVYVHAWTGLGGEELARMNDTPQGLLRWALIDLLGRNSVPLLSLVSGWLVEPSLGRRGVGAFLTSKARTIVAPMLAWNLIALFLVSGAAWLGWIYAPVPRSLGWTLDELFSITRPGEINVQMYFLRDLFVCMVAAPLLVRLGERGLAILMMAGLAWCLSGLAFPLLIRPPILLFFLLGIWVRRRNLACPLGAQPIWPVAIAYLLVAAMQIGLEVAGGRLGLNDPFIVRAVDLATRFATALFFWTLAWRLAASRWAAGLVRLEPYMFLLFCSHLVMMWLAGPVVGSVTGPMGSPTYPALLLAQPLLVLGATLLLARALAKAPALARLLGGGRLPAPDGGTARDGRRFSIS